MPELPEVETVCRGLAPLVEGRQIVRVQQRRADLRWPFPDAFAERLTGDRIVRLTRRAKYIQAQLESGAVLLIHLGMSGRLFVSDTDDDALERHDHVVFDFNDQIRVLYRDHRRFGMMDLVDGAVLDRHFLLQNLGPEPLSNHFNADSLVRKLHGRKSSIKAALLDQRVVAGLGNIYVCEALFRAGTSPRRQAGTIKKGRAEKLVGAIRDVLNDAIASGGSSLRDYVQSTGELGYFQHRFQVYDREGEPCITCAAEIVRIVQSGRSSFYCGTCQR